MARYEMLNNIAHRDLKVATGFGPQFGDAWAWCRLSQRVR